MSNVNQPPPGPGGEPQNWTPPPGQPPQPQPQPQPQYAPPTQPQPQYGPPPQQQYAPVPPPRSAPSVNMQSVNQLVTNSAQLVRVLRAIAWVELIVIVLLQLIGACSSLTYSGLVTGGTVYVFTSLLVTILQALVYWGVLMGVALLLENQSNRP